jgi:hypothetical protein
VTRVTSFFSELHGRQNLRTNQDPLYFHLPAAEPKCSLEGCLYAAISQQGEKL